MRLTWCIVKGVGTISRVGGHICRARELETPWGSGGFAPKGVQGPNPWLGGLGAKPPEAESFLDFWMLNLLKYVRASRYISKYVATIWNQRYLNKKKQFEVEETYSMPRIDYDEAFLTSNICLSRMYTLGLLTMTYI